MFRDLKENQKCIIGCIHLIPLPTTPYYQSGNMEKCVKKAIHDAKALYNGGANGCIIQNIDKVFVNTDDTDYALATCMAVIGNEVRHATGPDFKVGIQIMWNSITPSLAACKAAGADWTRCSVLSGESTSAFGKLEGVPMKVMKYRKLLDMPNFEMLAEAAGYHNLVGDHYDPSGIIAKAKDMLKVGADAVEISHADEEINNRMEQDLKKAIPGIKIILGGHTSVENVHSRLRYADGAVVGSCFENGNWGGEVYEETVAKYMAEVRKLEEEGI
jgi:membrane complex biogenesis BtpA family protein